MLAWSSPAFRAAAVTSALETKSTPGSTATVTWEATSELIRASPSICDTKTLVRPVRTIAPISATPSEEPSCCPVYCRPPASPRPDASTDDCTTLPSWETMSPIPTPSRAIDVANRASVIVGCTVAMSMSTASAVVVTPNRTIARTGYLADSRAPAAEARNIRIDTGNILMPVSRASRPSTSCRYSGTTKKTPIMIRFWLNRPTSPERSGGTLTRSRWTSGSSAVASR